MNITFDNSAKVSGKLTLVVEEADYANDYEKALKDYRKKANVPGFRPGKAPMAMIKRQIGPSVLVDTLNRLVGEKLYEYVQNEKIAMLGEPMPATDQEPNAKNLMCANKRWVKGRFSEFVTFIPYTSKPGVEAPGFDVYKIQV